MILPAGIVVYVVTLFWQNAAESKWRIAVERGFAPLTVGLILATSLVMSRAADHDWRAYLLTGRLHVDLRTHQAQPADRGRRGGRARIPGRALSRRRTAVIACISVVSRTHRSLGDRVRGRIPC